MIRAYQMTITTTAGGAATVYSAPLTGLLHALTYAPGTLDTGADLTITDEATGAALLTVSNAGTSGVTWMPRGATVDTSNAASLYAAGGEPVEDRLPVVGRVKCVVAQGGNAKTGTLWAVMVQR